MKYPVPNSYRLKEEIEKGRRVEIKNIEFKYSPITTKEKSIIIAL